MTRFAALCLLVLFPAVSRGQDEDAPPPKSKEDSAKLKVGDPAPPLKVEKWLKGKPVNLAEGKGKQVYVVEFWATWCGPCIQNIPHLTKLAEHFGKKDVTVIGVSIDGDRTRDDVEPFMKGSMGQRMGYTVALDDAEGSTNAAYLDAAGVRGIPHAFIVGKDGKIAWHGHPAGPLDRKLAELVGDKDYLAKALKLDEARKALRAALADEMWDETLKAADDLLKLDPEETRLGLLKYEVLATKKRDQKAAEAWGRELVEKLGDANALNELSWGILTEEDYEGIRDLKLALAAGKKANDLTEGKDFSILDTYARALFETGSKKEALALQKKSVEIAKQKEVPEEQLEELQKALERYEKGS